MTQVYIASSFGLRDRVRAVCDRLVEAGYDVPDRWWEGDRLADGHPDAGTDAYYDDPRVVETADRHWENLHDSDVFVLVAPRDEARKFNGANIEYGFALATGAGCYAVGRIERSAMYAPITRVDAREELLAQLREDGHGP